MLKKLFFSSLVISLILSMSSNNMMIMWLSMELNSMSFITLINSKNFFKFNSLILMKYFMVQSVGSMMFFVTFLLININYCSINNLFLMMFFIMMMKLGMPPFFYWYMNMMKSINWTNCMILSILQKIIPLVIMMKYLIFNNLILLIMMCSSILSVLLGLKTSMMKQIMTYSSINHLSWMTILLLISEKFFITYFILYSILSAKIMMYLKINNLNYLNEINNIKSKMILLMIMMSMLSLSGLPPFMGFILKWFSLKTIFLKNYKIMIIMVLMLINSAITMLYYLNLLIPFMFINSKTMNYKLILMNKIKTYFNITMFSSMYLISINKLI